MLFFYQAAIILVAKATIIFIATAATNLIYRRFYCCGSY